MRIPRGNVPTRGTLRTPLLIAIPVVLLSGFLGIAWLGLIPTPLRPTQTVRIVWAEDGSCRVVHEDGRQHRGEGLYLQPHLVICETPAGGARLVLSTPPQAEYALDGLYSVRWINDPLDDERVAVASTEVFSSWPFSLVSTGGEARLHFGTSVEGRTPAGSAELRMRDLFQGP